jgi:hypothetical protein
VCGGALILQRGLLLRPTRLRRTLIRSSFVLVCQALAIVNITRKYGWERMTVLATNEL